MSSKGNIVHVTGPLWGIPLTQACDAEFDAYFDLPLNKNSWANNRDAGD